MDNYHTFSGCDCGHDSADHDDVCICYACNPSRAAKALEAADAFATAFETNVTWRDPFDYEGVARSRRAVADGFANYLKARGRETMLP